MTADEINRIEQELGITLPPAYHDFLVPFPIPAFRGNNEIMLWDNVEEIVRLNKELREGDKHRDPWPKRFFALGEDSGGCSDAIDLDDPEFGVFWFDRQHIDLSEGQRSDEKLEQWLARQIKDITADLMADAIDPDAAPKERREKESAGVKAQSLGCVLVLLILAAVLLIGVWVGMKRSEAASVHTDQRSSMITKILNAVTGKDDLERIASKGDIALLEKYLESRPVFVPALPTKFLDAATSSDEDMLAFIEEQVVQQSEAIFEPWILESDGERRLPVFSSLKCMQVFSGEMSKSMNQIFALGGEEMLIADIREVYGIDVLDVNRFSKGNWEIGLKKR